MATNQYFNLHGTNTPEQRLIENLNIEAIKTFGIDVHYCPRTLNGRQMYDDAQTELDTISEQMSLRYELPVDHLIG